MPTIQTQNPQKFNYFRLIIKGVLAMIITLAALFVIAGRINYWQAWVFIGIVVLYLIIQLIIFKDKADLIKERVKPGAGAKWWDKVFFVLYTPSMFAIFLVGALDSGRFSWTMPLPIIFYIVGYFLFISALIILSWSMRENPWFSRVVRIQKDRGQQVIQSGPYSFVRHPGYVAVILMCFGMALTLGSIIAFIPAFIVGVFIIIRTYLEDITLQKELPGYLAYTQKTRYRLLPKVW